MLVSQTYTDVSDKLTFDTATVGYLGFVLCAPWTTHDVYLASFIAVKDLVGIESCILIIC